MSEQNALIVGQTGADHQLGLSLSRYVNKVYFAGNNPGTDSIENGINLPTAEDDHVGIEAFVSDPDNHCDLAIIGSASEILTGLPSKLRRHTSVLAPTMNAAQLEGSRNWTLDFMDKEGIPHPFSLRHKNTLRELDDPTFYLSLSPELWVVKTNRPANGEGVVIPETAEDVERTIRGMYDGSLYNGAGKNFIVVQERLSGPTLTATILSDGKNYAVLPFSQVQNKLLDDDSGPNTAGMGALAPVSNKILKRRQRDEIYSIIDRSIEGSLKRGRAFRGVMQIGIILAKEYDNSPLVTGYNVSFGNPETQVILPLLDQQDIDIYSLFRKAAEGSLRPDIDLSQKVGGAALTVTLAADGYPTKPVIGDQVLGVTINREGIIVQQNATRKENGHLISDGGRVVNVTGTGTTLAEARERAYANIGPGEVHFDGMQYRKDIGRMALELISR